MVAAKNILIKDLAVTFETGGKAISILQDVNLELKAGRFTAILGESGCGKSVLMQGLLGILPGYATTSGEILFAGRNTLVPGTRLLDARELGVIPQSPGDSLNPIRKIGKQFQDVLELAGLEDKDNRLKLKYLQLFGLKEGKRVLEAYPFELSGGMLQRVLCALSYCLEPEWLLADEPTKGLDEVTAAVVYENLLKIKALQQCSMVMVTHDIKLADQVCDEIVIMYAGQVLEVSQKVLQEPKHPYTQGFMRALPEQGFQSIPGTPPHAGEVVKGCVFANRCNQCQQRCLEERPELYTLKDGKTKVRCFLYAGA